jgi:hypothetical protein
VATSVDGKPVLALKLGDQRFCVRFGDAALELKHRADEV